MDGSGLVLFEVGTRDKSLIARLTVVRVHSTRRTEVKARTGEAGRELASPKSNRGVQGTIRRKRGASRRCEPPSKRGVQGENRRVESCRVIIGQKRGRKERVVESRTAESSSSGRGAQGDVESHRAEGGRKEKSIEWKGAELLSKGRGAEEGRDLLSRTGGAARAEPRGGRQGLNGRRAGGVPS
ncbi:unnamed protein product [Sphagnum balticum]